MSYLLLTSFPIPQLALTHSHGVINKVTIQRSSSCRTELVEELKTLRVFVPFLVPSKV